MRNPNRHLSNYQIRRMTLNPKHRKWDRATRQVGKGRNCLVNKIMCLLAEGHLKKGPVEEAISTIVTVRWWPT
jgi:hypothetical protein